MVDQAGLRGELFIFQYLRPVPAGPAESTSKDFCWPWSFTEVPYFLLTVPLLGTLDCRIGEKIACIPAIPMWW